MLRAENFTSDDSTLKKKIQSMQSRLAPAPGDFVHFITRLTYLITCPLYFDFLFFESSHSSRMQNLRKRILCQKHFLVLDVSIISQIQISAATLVFFHRLSFFFYSLMTVRVDKRRRRVRPFFTDLTVTKKK